MSENNDVPLPSVPDGEGVAAYVAVPDRERVVPDIEELLTGPDDVSIRSLVLGPATIPGTVGAYAVAGEKGLDAIEDEVRDWATGLDAGKVSKYDAYYFPQTPLPFGVWEYACETCRFYVEPEDSPSGEARCEVVGQEGDLFGGQDIHPRGWCALWMPEEGKRWFEFVEERLESRAGGD